MAVLVAMVFSIIVGRCQYPTPQKAIAPTALIFSAEQIWQKVGLEIVVKTNLPEGTFLMATLNDKRGRMAGQDEAYVRSGAARFEAFTKARPAQTISISAPLSIMQTGRVQALVGKGYSNFASPIIKKRDDDAMIETEVRVIPR